jgi:hypothetical protein
MNQLKQARPKQRLDELKRGVEQDDGMRQPDRQDS